MRLFGRGLAGDVRRLSTSVSAAPAGFSAYGSYDQAHRYHVFAANDGTAAATYDLDFSLTPGTAAGAEATIEQVSTWCSAACWNSTPCRAPGNSR